MWRWFRWVLLVLITFIIGVVVFLCWKYFFYIKMNPSLRQRAEAALAEGITIDDPQNDFLNQDLLGKEMDLVNSYTLASIDIKSLSFGMDDKYFYYKTTVWGTIPQKPENVNGDYIVACGPQLSLNNEKGQTQATLAADWGWMPEIHIFSMNTWYATGPTGITWPESERMKNQKFDSKVYGGAGTDYIMGAFPLDKLDFNIGDTAYISFPMECKSEQHTHASVDHLGGSGKMEALITWKVGTKEVYVDNDFNYGDVAK